MIVIWPNVCVDMKLPDTDGWGLVHRNVGGEEELHAIGDEYCWCSPICVQVAEHTQGELETLYITSLH
jgi:hypothetical protein